jgi:hypothetical protein
MTLGDCTFLYSIIRDCTFLSTRLNAESVGLIFGLDEPALTTMEFVYLGHQQVAPPSHELVDSLLDSYARREWHMGVLVMRVNFRRTSVLHAFSEFLFQLRTELRSGRPIRSDETTFLAAIMSELAEQQRLPLMSVMDAVDAVPSRDELVVAYGDDEVIRVADVLQTLAARLFLIVHEMLAVFDTSRLAVDAMSSDATVRVSLEYHDKPALPLAPLMTELGRASGLPIVHPSTTLDARHGSYTEYIEATLLTVLAFQMFVYLVTGCVIRVTELRARIEVLKRKRLPTAYLKQALDPRQPMPRQLLAPFQNLTAHARQLGWLREPDMRQVGPPNLANVTLEVSPRE